MIKTRFLTSGCFWLVVETTNCVLIISLCLLELLKGNKGRDCISTGKRSVCVYECVHSGGGRGLDRGRCQRRLHWEGDFVTGLKSLFYLFPREALSVTESLSAWDSSSIKIWITILNSQGYQEDRMREHMGKQFVNSKAPNQYGIIISTL